MKFKKINNDEVSQSIYHQLYQHTIKFFNIDNPTTMEH